MPNRYLLHKLDKFRDNFEDIFESIFDTSAVIEDEHHIDLNVSALRRSSAVMSVRLQFKSTSTFAIMMIGILLYANVLTSTILLVETAAFRLF